MTASLATATVATHLAGHGGHGGPGGHGGFGWWFLLIPQFWILVLILVFAIFGRRWRRAAMAGGYGPQGRMNPARRAEVTLAERYAQGDIDEIEYRKRLEVLRANAVPPA